MSSLFEAAAAFEEAAAHGANPVILERSGKGQSSVVTMTDMSGASSRAPTSAEIDAVIAAAIANAPPPPPSDFNSDINRSVTPLMTNLLPSAVGSDGRVNLFVGNLPYRVRWQDLKDLFRKAGTVLRADVSLGPDNRSRGYGTVLMGSREDAARAIDRYNGYTWQTRTLEVRPDRLPPEYEPQSHPIHHNANPRTALYSFHNFPGPSHTPFSIPGHITPQSGQGWLPGQIPSSRPFSAAGGLIPGGMGIPSSSSAVNLTSSTLLPGAQSPPSVFGAPSLPLSVQNTGLTAFHSLSQSPLAGSLTSGTGAAMPASVNAARRESLTPFGASLTSFDSTSAPLPSTSPNMAASRPTSSSDSVKPPSPGGSRAPPPGTLGPLPPSLFAGIKPAPAVDAMAPAIVGDVPAQSPNGGAGRLAAPIPQLEGLANQGMGLGPPSTLHDRVIFVSNLPLSMQWQDLKDMLRPAGTIIRADVATDAHGKPRGFGTALFATEADATRAVLLFNDREIGGFRIRAHLERDIHPEVSQRSARNSVSGESTSMGIQDHLTGIPEGVKDMLQSNGITPIDTSVPSTKPSSTSPIAKLPWSLNTSLQTHAAPGHGHPPPHGESPPPSHTPVFRHPHHPGPISMPPFHMEHGNSISPLHTRGLPPMTPSMPGFVFNYPETPPLHGHASHFMSPAAGPFSPGIPVTSPGAFQYNPFLNPAPGAPVNRFPSASGNHPQAGSAALGTPTTQAFPNGPIGYGQYAGPPGGALQGKPDNSPKARQRQDYFANAIPPQHATSATGNRMLGVGTLGGKEKLGSSPLSGGDGQNDSDEETKAPSPVGDELAKMAEDLTVDDENEDGEPVRRSPSGFSLSGLGSNAAVSPGGGRTSMDDGKLDRH
ncbi:telomere maintenance protein [Cryptococcus neoformans]|nr:telomere maintenance protein [Cryptococcus neoformans var. grubii]OXC62200.1 telomere maintenance protein [Cryptococcus neoformans var. grubii MW-RSA852]